MFNVVVTTTVSPAVKRREGTKLPPRLSESPISVPFMAAAAGAGHGDRAQLVDRHAPEDDLVSGEATTLPGTGTR